MKSKSTIATYFNSPDIIWKTSLWVVDLLRDYWLVKFQTESKKIVNVMRIRQIRLKTWQKWDWIFCVYRHLNAFYWTHSQKWKENDLLALSTRIVYRILVMRQQNKYKKRVKIVKIGKPFSGFPFFRLCRSRIYIKVELKLWMNGLWLV